MIAIDTSSPSRSALMPGRHDESGQGEAARLRALALPGIQALADASEPTRTILALFR